MSWDKERIAQNVRGALNHRKEDVAFGSTEL